MSEKLRNKSWCNILKSYIVHWQPHKERIGEGFKQHNNQQIIRDKGSNKYVILFTAVAIFIRKLHTNYLANVILIHQIIKLLPQNI